MRYRIQAIAGAAALAVAGTLAVAGPALASGTPAPIVGSVTVLASISLSADQTAFQYGGAGYVAVAGSPSAFKMGSGQATPDYSITVTSGDPAGYTIMQSATDFTGSSQTFPAADATAFFTTTAPMASPGPTSGGIAGSNAPVVVINHASASGASGDQYFSYNSVTPPATLVSTSLLAMSTTIQDSAIAN